jgi:hypothetical protein
MLLEIVNATLASPSGRQKLLVLLMLIAASATLVALWTSGPIGAGLIGVLLATIFFLTKSVWLPNCPSERVRRLPRGSYPSRRHGRAGDLCRGWLVSS